MNVKQVKGYCTNRVPVGSLKGGTAFRLDDDESPEGLYVRINDTHFNGYVSLHFGYAWTLQNPDRMVTLVDAQVTYSYK